MQQLSQIADIIEETLNYEGPLTLSEDQAHVLATKCAQNLVRASLEQLASILGTTLEVNDSQEAVVNTGFKMADEHGNF